MRLEKFDYQIGNKKTKNKFIALGVLCIALIITIALYKTFASFSSTASYSIINAIVEDFSDNRTEIVKIDISKSSEDEVYAILYDDNTLTIDGTGYMKDFTEVDLIGEVLDEFINQKLNTIFSAEELEFVNADKPFMYTLFDYAARGFMQRDSIALEQAIANKYEDNEDIETIHSLMTKINNLNFDIDQIEIINNVKNIGENAFSLDKATSSSNIRDNIYTNISSSKDYKCNINTSSQIDRFIVEADLEEVGENAMLDINSTNIDIGSNVSIIPDDLFAWYNGGNEIVCEGNSYSQKESKSNVSLTIPNGVTKIGVNAFYSYNGQTLNLPGSVTEIDEYAFANYYGNNITIHNTITIIKTGAFRDFEGVINMGECLNNNDFAPNADVMCE